MSTLRTMIVLYRSSEALPADPPEGFRCRAENGEHAEEQCKNFLPDCDVLWTFAGDDMPAALADYFSTTPGVVS